MWMTPGEFMESLREFEEHSRPMRENEKSCWWSDSGGDRVKDPRILEHDDETVVSRELVNDAGSRVTEYVVFAHTWDDEVNLVGTLTLNH